MPQRGYKRPSSRLCQDPGQFKGAVFASYGTLLGDDVALELLYGYSYIGDVLTRIGAEPAVSASRRTISIRRPRRCRRMRGR